MPAWQSLYSDRLMQRLARNAARRKVAMALAAGAAVSKTWGSTADPDLDIATEMKNSGDITGIQPNRVLFGLAASCSPLRKPTERKTPGGSAGR